MVDHVARWNISKTLAWSLGEQLVANTSVVLHWPVCGELAVVTVTNTKVFGPSFDTSSITFHMSTRGWLRRARLWFTADSGNGSNEPRSEFTVRATSYRADVQQIEVYYPSFELCSLASS